MEEKNKANKAQAKSKIDEPINELFCVVCQQYTPRIVLFAECSHKICIECAVDLCTVQSLFWTGMHNEDVRHWRIENNTHAAAACPTCRSSKADLMGTSLCSLLKSSYVHLGQVLLQYDTKIAKDIDFFDCKYCHKSYNDQPDALLRHTFRCKDRKFICKAGFQPIVRGGDTKECGQMFSWAEQMTKSKTAPSQPNDYLNVLNQAVQTHFRTQCKSLVPCTHCHRKISISQIGQHVHSTHSVGLLLRDLDQIHHSTDRYVSALQSRKLEENAANTKKVQAVLDNAQIYLTDLQALVESMEDVPSSAAGHPYDLGIAIEGGGNGGGGGAGEGRGRVVATSMQDMIGMLMNGMMRSHS